MRKWIIAAAVAAVFAVPGAALAQSPIIIKFSHVVANDTPKTIRMTPLTTSIVRSWRPIRSPRCGACRGASGWT